MASTAAGSKCSSRGSSSSPPAWTQRQNKQFECALAVHDKDTPDRWHDVARYMGGSRSADEVRRHFEQLVEDVAQIASGRVPFPRYSSSSFAHYPPSTAAAGARRLDIHARSRLPKVSVVATDDGKARPGSI